MDHSDILREMHGDIKVIKNQVSDFSSRISPIEDDFKFRARLYKLILGGSGIITILGLAISYLHH